MNDWKEVCTLIICSRIIYLTFNGCFRSCEIHCTLDWRRAMLNFVNLFELEKVLSFVHM